MRCYTLNMHTQKDDMTLFGPGFLAFWLSLICSFPSVGVRIAVFFGGWVLPDPT